MIVLDASVLIAFLDRDDSHHEAATTLLGDEVDDEFGVNPITLAEVLTAPARSRRLASAQGILNDLDVRELAFPAETAARLARLRASTGLKMPDCCVLLAAEEARARVASFDDQLIRAARKRKLRVVAH